MRWERLRRRTQGWARSVKRDLHAAYLASRSPNMPWAAKLLAVIVVGYALSPIDLIPDFVPVLGYLDDLLLLPFGIWLIVRLIPPDVMAECRAAADRAQAPPRSRTAAAVIVLVWLAAAAILARWVFGLISHQQT